MSDPMPAGVHVTGASSPAVTAVLTPETLAFVADLHRQFNARRIELLAARRLRQQRFDAGELPGFLPETLTGK